MTNIRSFAGQRPQIDSSAWIDESAVVIGDVEIGPQSSVWPMCVVRGDIHSIRIGAMTNIQDSCVLHVSHDSRFLAGGAPLVIGDQVTVGHQAVLHGCEVGESCLVGIGARVLDQAVLEPLTMLGAGALVPPGRVLEGGYLWIGAPAKRARPLTDRELEYLTYAAEHYVRLAQKHRNSHAFG